MSKAETPDPIESLTERAKEIQARIDKSDSIIASEQKNRAAHAKHLRSLTSKIVTLQIKGAA